MTDPAPTRGQSTARRSNRRMAGGLAVVVIGMVGMAYASVPLYEIFCRVTGFGGTTQVAELESEQVIDRTFTIRFDSNVNDALPWQFVPAVNEVDVKVGENKLGFYRATNTSDETVVGTATFNVTPDKAGLYFNKVQCFCFTEQVLKPGETVDMPVSFFLDPALMDDAKMDGLTTITLSYTFFRARDQSAAEQVAFAPASANDETVSGSND
ncbi:MAG: cytochrome c oxidase assembly protein [Alphaproteobacteria bacterium]|nr:cytochrome c oxidase assembly protein [Alphaproteobacteria bacterium]